MRPHLRTAVLALAASATLLPSAAATQQFQVGSRTASVTLVGNVQTQYTISSIDGADNDFFFRRARFGLDVRVNDFLSGILQPDFAGGQVAMKDAFMRLTFSDAFVLSIGQFKRAFDLFQLASSADLSLVERDGRVEGLSTCTGVGSICSYGRFVEALGYSDRDQGLRVSGTSGSMTYQATVTNGTGGTSPDENDRKSLSGRATFAVSERLRVSGQVGLHDYVDAAGNATAVALAGDVEHGTWRNGLLIQASVVGGDNWRALDVNRDPATFYALQGFASYYYPLDGERIIGIEPLARASWGDPDTDADDDGGFLFTPGVMLYISGRTKIGANLDVYAPQTGDKEFSFKLLSHLYF
jgi:hypothetical protein